MFRAVHVRGPLAGEDNDVGMSAPYVPERLWYAPAPAGVHTPTPAGYMLVGWDRAPELAWPGQVEYALDREHSQLYPHERYEDMREGTAVYVLVS